MFGKEKRPKAQSPKALQQAFEGEMPEVAFVDARNEFYEAMGTPVVDRGRFFVIICLLLFVLIVFGFAAVRFLPLKTTEPYVIELDRSRGVTSAGEGTAKRASEYTPDRPVLERELFTFVERLYAINGDYPKLVQDGHKAAYAYTRGRAISEFKAFMDAEQPYQRQKAMPGLIRTVEKKTVSFREDGKLVLIRYRAAERSNVQTVPVMRDFLMTLQFLREQPTEKEELDRNPLGIYITHFETVEER